MVLDTARLLKQNKLTKEDLAKMDKTFREEVVAYAATMPEEEDLSSLSITPKEKPDLLKGYIPTRPKGPSGAHDDAAQVVVNRAPQPMKPVPPPQPKPVTPVTPPKPVPPPPPVRVATEEELLQAKLQDFAKKKAVLEEETRIHQLERNTLIGELESVRAKERGVEQEESELRKKEKEAPVGEMKNLEEKRWTLEDSRQLLEKSRWDIHKKIDGVDARMAEIYKNERGLIQEEDHAKKDLEKIVLKREAKVAAEQKVVEEKAYAAIQAKKKKYETDWVRLKEEVKHLKVQVEKTDGGARSLKDQIEEVEKTESTASTEQHRHDLEEKRWDLDKKLREIEKSVWQLDADAAQKTKEIEAIEKIFAEIQLEEEASKKKMQDYASIIIKAERSLS